MNELVRCFLAIAVHPSLIEVILGIQADIKRRAGGGDVRWVGPDQLHVTLCFLGELSVAQLVALQEPVVRVCSVAQAMVLSLDKLSGFPNPIQPRIVTLEIGGAVSALKTLQSSLAAAVSPFAPAMDDKPFAPHLTLGRLKTESEMARTGIGRALRMVSLPSCPSFEVARVELIRSDLSATGPTYALVRSFPLG